MADHGLRVWDDNGNVMTDITDRMPRALGQFTTPSFSSGSRSGSVQHTAFQNNQAFWWIEGFEQGGGFVYFTYNIYQSGDRLHWSFNITANPQAGAYLGSFTVVYGIL